MHGLLTKYGAGPFLPRMLNAAKPYSTPIALGLGGAAGAGTYALTGDPAEAGAIGTAAGIMFRPGLLQNKYMKGVKGSPNGGNPHEAGLEALSHHALMGVGGKALLAGGFAGAHQLPKLLDRANTTLQNVQDVTGNIKQVTGDVVEPAKKITKNLTTASDNITTASDNITTATGDVSRAAAGVPKLLDTVGDAAKNVGNLNQTVARGVDVADKGMTSVGKALNTGADAVAGVANWGKQNAPWLIGGGMTAAGLYALAQWYKSHDEEARRRAAAGRP